MLKRLWDTTDCTFSDCKRYRYTLTRHFAAIGRKGRVAFVMLNPSTADANNDDPTVRRCVGYAYDWGFADLEILNMFAYRSTDPENLFKATDPIGPENDQWIVKKLRTVDLVVCAWGAHPTVIHREPRVLELIEIAGKTPTCLKRSDAGHPCHPLYLKKTLKPVSLVTS